MAPGHDSLSQTVQSCQHGKQSDDDDWKEVRVSNKKTFALSSIQPMKTGWNNDDTQVLKV